MNGFILIIVLFLTAACSSDIKKEIIDKGDKICEQNGGLQKITIPHVLDINGPPSIMCNNGAIFERVRIDSK